MVDETACEVRLAPATIGSSAIAHGKGRLVVISAEVWKCMLKWQAEEVPVEKPRPRGAVTGGVGRLIMPQ